MPIVAEAVRFQGAAIGNGEPTYASEYRYPTVLTDQHSGRLRKQNRANYHLLDYYCL